MKTLLPAALLVFAGASLVSPTFAHAPAPPFSLGKPASAADKAPRRAVLFALRIEQAAPDGASSPPTILATPALSTLNNDTATIAVSNIAFAYSVALSPVIIKGEADETVQTAWVVRLTGKNLPAGNTSVTLSGTTRLPVGKEGTLTEISLRDGVSGKTTLYRIVATPTLPEAANPAK